MLKPKVERPSQPPWKGGCVHETNLTIEVDPDLCHIRSAAPKKRLLCGGCKSPYKARVMYKSDKDHPEPMTTDSRALEAEMVTQLHVDRPAPLECVDADDDDADVGGEVEQDSSSGPAAELETGSEARDTARVLKGKELVEMAARVEALRKHVKTAGAIQRALGGLSKDRYEDLILFSKFSTDYKALIVKYDLSLSAAVEIEHVPERIRGTICDLLDRRRFKMKTLQDVIRRDKVRPGNLRDFCISRGIKWI
jgi:hypothetical protein